MIYISLLLDTVNVLLSLIIINFLYKIYIAPRGNESVEENSINNELPIEGENVIEDNEIIYAEPQEDFLEVDERLNDEPVELNEELFAIDEPKILEQEEFNEPISEIKDDEEIVVAWSLTNSSNERLNVLHS